MSSPKKKLPTGPIRLDIPTPQTLEAREAEAISQESILPENKKQDLQKQDFDSAMEIHPPNQPESPAGEISEERKQDSCKQDYKKVAMRLSAESFEKLRQLRVNTGLPYEILVDVMIRHWDNLPQRTQAAYLKEAQSIRGERLIEGQLKALQSIQTKHSTR